MNDKNELFQRGLEIRRAVVGAAHVDASMARANALTAPLQELVTQFCWGAIWGREDLDRRTRSLITVALLTSMSRPLELELHVVGAKRNGCTGAEIRDAVMHAGIYCGIPAAMDAMRTVVRVLGSEAS